MRNHVRLGATDPHEFCEGTRNVFVRREITDGTRVIVLYGLGYRTLFWREM